MRSIELSTYVLNVHLCKKMNSLVDSEMKVYYVSEVLKQGTNIKTMYPNYIFEFKNTNSHLLHVYPDTWTKIETVTAKSSLLNCWSLLL